MALLPPDMDANCNRKQRCLFGSNAGLAYDPSNACPPDKTFNELLCDCEDYFECDCNCHNDCPECYLCVNGECQVDPICDASKTYFAVYKRYVRSNSCTSEGIKEQGVYQNLLSGRVDGTLYYTYSWEFVREEVIAEGITETIWQTISTLADYATGEVISSGPTGIIETTGEQPTAISIVGDQIECFTNEGICESDSDTTVCYDSSQQVVQP